ncbi:hypothetical protein E8E14_001281 [Neopestalotiopsis sp. 37M]|nr:hypothetical protein E8E14_001281 [Neopestalotiopsis sp. 37M]
MPTKRTPDQLDDDLQSSPSKKHQNRPHSFTQDLFRVDGLVALVTGGGAGIGLMIAKALASNGATRVYISGRRKHVLEEAAKESPFNNIIPIVADVSSKEQIEALAEQIRINTGYLNLLVNNAGTWGPGPDQRWGTSVREFQAEAMKITMEEWDDCFRVNVHACYFTTMAVLDLLDEGNAKKNYCNGDVRSQVLMVGSVGGFSRILGGRYAYRASKSGVTHLAKCLSTGFQEFGIRVNTLAPGLFPSEMTIPLMQKYNATAGEDGKMDPKRLPEQRAGSEEDMIGTILYLASRAGAYTNGSVCVVDGGMTSIMPSTY